MEVYRASHHNHYPVGQVPWVQAKKPDSRHGEQERTLVRMQLEEGKTREAAILHAVSG